MALAKIPKARSVLEETFALQIRQLGLPAPEREYEFDPEHHYRADYAWPPQQVLVELEGHAHRAHVGRYMSDIRKYDRAAELGFCLLRFTRRDVVKSWVAVEYVRDLLQRRTQR
jgi:very-short-patch-repair endonuclease